MEETSPIRKDHRIIIHFDYDCFYAAVFERENPTLKSLPLAVQQKQIIVTCNYEARRRGLFKLQLVREAREVCPDVIIVLGEDLTRFRNASKELYSFLKCYVWGNKIERLGFDEVFMDVTDIIEYNVSLLNHNSLPHSFFHLNRTDPAIGFLYDASSIAGHTFPAKIDLRESSKSNDSEDLWWRLRLGSRLAQHVRHLLEEQKGFTSTVGISSSKLVSKLVGNLNKPKGQTTLIPPYLPDHDGESHIHQFIDDHDIGRIPGIGFKIAQKIRGHILGRLAAHHTGLVYGGTKENIKVSDVRSFEGMGPKLLSHILNGPGVPKDLPDKIWGLINGVDDSEVAVSRTWPQQISIEDSYIRLDEFAEVKRELTLLAASLLKRMRLDLTASVEDEEQQVKAANTRPSSSNAIYPVTLRWAALPRTIRLSTRPRPPVNPDGTRSRSFTRVSKSGPMPTFVFNLTSSIDELSEKLATETLMPLFRKLHPEKSGWNLSLVNVCATNMAVAASDGKDSAGRDISWMFKRQDEVLKDWKVQDTDMDQSNMQQSRESPSTTTQIEQNMETETISIPVDLSDGSEGGPMSTLESENLLWDSEDENTDMGEICMICGASMPSFAMKAHDRFHELQH